MILRCPPIFILILFIASVTLPANGDTVNFTSIPGATSYLTIDKTAIATSTIPGSSPFSSATAILTATSTVNNMLLAPNVTVLSAQEKAEGTAKARLHLGYLLMFMGSSFLFSVTKRCIFEGGHKQGLRCAYGTFLLFLTCLVDSCASRVQESSRVDEQNRRKTKRRASSSTVASVVARGAKSATKNGADDGAHTYYLSGMSSTDEDSLVSSSTTLELHPVSKGIESEGVTPQPREVPDSASLSRQESPQS
eukprot:GILI01036763.1.p1 GENE.GILI01036763.1~~GILI01036763.1.p1  ORF type:complete len:251 (+),score=22.15 GILI01036763.1:87-839(+)